MKKRKLKRNEMILTMKVFPLHADPDEVFYRYIEMPSLASLYDLAETIIDSIGFDFDHSFGFYSDFKRPFKSQSGYELFADVGEETNFPGVKKTIIEDAFPGTGSTLLFYFDYGDCWQFPVQVWGARMADEEDACKTFPILVKSAGEAPEQYPDYDETDEEDYEENSTGGEAEIIVRLTDKEKKLILEHTFAENSLTDRLKTAELKDGIIIVKYSPDDLEGLIGFIAAEANHAENKALQKKLDALYDKMNDMLSENE